MYAEVAVNRRVSSTFHYHIPAELSGRIAPGHLVKVSFGTAQTTGIVIALHDSTPVPITKPLLERLDPEPVVTPAQLDLARWLSEQTVTSLGMCLWLMLPPGLAKRGDTLYTLVDEGAEGRSETQKRAEPSPAARRRGRQINHALPHTDWQKSLTGLVKRGIVQQDPLLGAPDVKPKLVRTAQLAIPAERISHIAPRLGRESRRANVLEVLLTTRGRRMSLGAILIAVGCTQDPIRTLEKSGDVAVGSKETWIELAIPPQEATARLEAGEFRRAPAQTRVLEMLLEAGHLLTPKQLNKPAVAAGSSEGWSGVAEPAMVELRLSPKEARRRIIDLRGGQPYLDILNALAEAGEALDVKEIHTRTGTTPDHLERLAEDGLIVLGEAETWRDPLVDREFVPSLAPPLTAEQTRAWETIRQYMDTVHWGNISQSPDVSGVFLLHGVTGSGKTEIYMRAVEHTLAQGRQTLDGARNRNSQRSGGLHAVSGRVAIVSGLSPANGTIRGGAPGPEIFRSWSARARRCSPPCRMWGWSFWTRSTTTVTSSRRRSSRPTITRARRRSN
jgi:primosomal protein N'